MDRRLAGLHTRRFAHPENHMNEITFGDVIRLSFAIIVIMVGTGIVARLGVAVAHAAALVAQLRFQATKVVPLSDGWYVVIEGGLLGSSWSPIRRDDADLIETRATRVYIPTEGATRHFALRLLRDSADDYGATSTPNRIRPMRSYPADEKLWRDATSYLAVNWDVISNGFEGTWAGPHYETVADLLVAVEARQVPPYPKAVSSTVTTQAQWTQRNTVDTGVR
jgi:hypothetical protein